MATPTPPAAASGAGPGAVTGAPRVFGAARPGREYVPRPSAYVVATDARGAVAVVRTPTGHWLPGGGLEAGEDARAAAVREAREEAGLVVRLEDAPLGETVDWVEAPREPHGWEKRCTFLAATVVATAEGSEAGYALAWMTPAEATVALGQASHRWAVEAWVARRGA